jgi:type III pantothenate kinase
VAKMDRPDSALDVDVGNSRIKWRLRVDQREMRGTIDRERILHAAEWPTARPSRIRVSSVASREGALRLAERLQSRFGVVPEFARTTRFAAGVTCGYEDPSRLGVDRWLSVLAARQLATGPFIVVGLGTAGTLDFVDAKGVHKGGFIVPGLRLMTEALLSGTADVHVAFEVSRSEEPGVNTEDAVRRGVVLMLSDFVNDSIRRFRATSADQIHVYVCGGDADVVASRIDVPVKIRPELVLDGLALALP